MKCIKLAVHDIPAEAWNYMPGNRSVLEWN
jgi:hypothetical protein